MVTRKQVLVSGAALAAVAVVAETAVFENAKGNYENVAIGLRRPISGTLPLQRELVRYATLAPSSHNTQCWKFHLSENAISILPDLTRRCPAVDPDDHHLFVSLGCAAENLIQASLVHGLRGTLNYSNAPNDELRVTFEPTEARTSPLSEAMSQRQCTRAEFDGKALSTPEMKLLEQAGKGEGVNVQFLTEKPALENILGFIIAGNTAQIGDPAFIAELKSWIRFSDAEAVRTGDGLFSRASGSPVLPSWIGQMLFSSFFNARTENEKYAKHIRSSAGVAIFVSEHNDKSHWIEVGRCYERFALQATALGIRNAMVNQPVEASEVRQQLASYLEIGTRRPDLVVRFGRGPTMPPSLRRPVEAVVI